MRRAVLAPSATASCHPALYSLTWECQYRNMVPGNGQGMHGSLHAVCMQSSYAGIWCQQ